MVTREVRTRRASLGGFSSSAALRILVSQVQSASQAGRHGVHDVEQILTRSVFMCLGETLDSRITSTAC